MADNEVTPEPTTPELNDFIDPITKKPIKITKDIEILIGHVGTVVRNAAIEKKKQEYEELQNQFNEVDGVKEKLAEQLRLIEEEKMTEKEKEESRRKAFEEKFKKEKDLIAQERDTYSNLYMGTKIDTDIMSATAGMEFNNLGQAIQVLKIDGQASLKKDASGQYVKDARGQHITVLFLPNDEGEIVEMTPKDAINYYFSKYENSHHLKKNLNPGSGSKPHGQTDASGNNVFKRDNMSDPNVRKDYFSALRNGKQVKLAK